MNAVANTKFLRPDEQAFTRLELVVVVFVIALLTGTIFPGLANSGMNNRRLVCTNNLKQMGAATTMYANDNNDYLALPNWAFDFPGWLFAPTNGTVPDPTTPKYSNDVSAAYSPGLWYPYVRNPKSYLCAVDIESPFYSSRINKLCSYVMNGAVSGYASRPTGCKVTDVWSPKCYLLWGPDENAQGFGNPGAFDFNDGANYPGFSERLEHLHAANGAEVLAVGGNVRFVSDQEFLAQANYVGTPQQPLGLSWWSPFTSGGH